MFSVLLQLSLVVVVTLVKTAPSPILSNGDGLIPILHAAEVAQATSTTSNAQIVSRDGFRTISGASKITTETSQTKERITPSSSLSSAFYAQCSIPTSQQYSSSLKSSNSRPLTRECSDLGFLLSGICTDLLATAAASTRTHYKIPATSPPSDPLLEVLDDQPHGSSSKTIAIDKDCEISEMLAAINRPHAPRDLVTNKVSSISGSASSVISLYSSSSLMSIASNIKHVDPRM